MLDLVGPSSLFDSNMDLPTCSIVDLALPHIPALVEPIVCPAVVALETTVSLAVPIAVLVRFPNPKTFCHVFPSASRTAALV